MAKGNLERQAERLNDIRHIRRCCFSEFDISLYSDTKLFTQVIDPIGGYRFEMSGDGIESQLGALNNLNTPALNAPFIAVVFLHHSTY